MILRKRPHFHIRDGAVRFLNSERSLPPLSDSAQALLLNLQDGPLNDPIASDAVSELIDRGLADLISPVTASGRRRVLVIEPHSDDAALSIGGLMWQQRNTLEFTLVTCASRSNYTSSFHTGRDFFNRDAVSALRKAEGEIFMAYLGGDYRVLDLAEATMRYANSDWSVDFFQAHRTSVAINNNRRAADVVLARWIAAITPLIVDPEFDEIWLPLGAGSHSDHDLTRNAALCVLIDHPEVIERADLRLYKDVPYGTDFSAHTEHVLKGLRQRGAVLTDEVADVTDDFDQKLDLLGIFASQFKPAHIAGSVERSAAKGAPKGRKVEHLWRMTKLPHTLDPIELFIETPAVRELRKEASGWCRNGSKVKRLRVLALAASGNWAQDEALLRAKFPNAQIVVYASLAARAEIAERKSADVVLHDVGHGTRPWLLLALKLAFMGPAHTLFIAGERLEQACQLAKLWPLSRTLTVRNMDQMTLAA